MSQTAELQTLATSVPLNAVLAELCVISKPEGHDDPVPEKLFKRCGATELLNSKW